MMTQYKHPVNNCTCGQIMMVYEQVEKNDNNILLKEKCSCGNTGITLMRKWGYSNY